VAGNNRANAIMSSRAASTLPLFDTSLQSEDPISGNKAI
jgi:hypothetical protein